MALIVRIHRRHDGTVLLAICDKSALGKKYSEGKLRIDTSGPFYKGEETPIEDLKELLPCATHLNLVGEESVGLAIDMGYVKKDKVVKIAGIPHAECVVLKNA